jgi:hypothetical protein
MSNEVNHNNDSTAAAATGKPDDVAGKLLADSTPAPATAGSDAKPTPPPLAIDNGQAPVIVDQNNPVDLFKPLRSEIAPAAAPEAGPARDAAAPAQADGPAVKGDRLAAAPAPAAATNPFGQLEITDSFKAVGDDKPLSPNMVEARRIEDQYRARYSENDQAMKAVGSVMSANNPDINGDITKESLDKALANAKTAAPDDARYGKDFQAGAQYLKDNWNDMSISPYKAIDGSINQKSAEEGTTRMTGEQDALAKRILATEMNAVNREKQAAAPAADTRSITPQAPALEPKDAIIKQSRTLLGEGPHQVAARVLGSDGKQLNDKQLKELTEAFKQSYEEQRKQHPEMHDLMGLKVGHEFITKENINSVMSKISDPALKERLTAIAGQDTAFKPPVITPIPHRPTPAHHQAEHAAHQPAKHTYPPMPPVRPAHFPAPGRS